MWMRLMQTPSATLFVRQQLRTYTGKHPHLIVAVWGLDTGSGQINMMIVSLHQKSGQHEQQQGAILNKMQAVSP
jgi:hypothetical protein